MIGPNTLVERLTLSSSLLLKSAVRWRYWAHKVLPLVNIELGDELLVSEGGSDSCAAVDCEDVVKEPRDDEDVGLAALAVPGNAQFSSTVSPSR